MNRLARIAITIGDPAGVGAEIALKALHDNAVASLADWLLVADSAALAAAGPISGINPASLPCTLIDTQTPPPSHAADFGQLPAEYAAAPTAYVRRAVEPCMSREA